MLKLFTGLLLAGLSTSANSTCDWSRPGEDPYIGRPVTAVHSFKSMPWLARHLLSQRVGTGTPNDLIEIGKSSIRGAKWTYANEIRNMHFGSAGRVCPSVSREGWMPSHIETGAVWCVKLPLTPERHCVARADVCGNFFQVTQVGWAPAGEGILPGSPRALPEPGTLALVALALMALRLHRK